MKAPLVLERLAERLMKRPCILRLECRDLEAGRPRGRPRRPLEVDPHAVVVTRLAKAMLFEQGARSLVLGERAELQLAQPAVPGALLGLCEQNCRKALAGEVRMDRDPRLATATAIDREHERGRGTAPGLDDPGGRDVREPPDVGCLFDPPVRVPTYVLFLRAEHVGRPLDVGRGCFSDREALRQGQAHRVPREGRTGQGARARGAARAPPRSG